MAVSASPVQEEAQTERAPLRNRLAAAVRSVNWSYAIFWSISSTQPGVLTWTDGFYNGEVKTRKVANSASLTAAQQVMQRSEQLRELYESLLSGACDRRAARPVASLSPEDLADAEWYYVVCMTYAFRPGQGLPGRSSASNQSVWLCNAHLADSKAFPRALLAKSASIQTIFCIPLMGGVLEMGTTDSITENPDLLSRPTTSFLEAQFPTCLEDPSSSPSANKTCEAADTDIIVFEDLDRNAIETMIAGEQELVGEAAAESLSDASLERIAKEIDEFYNLFDELDVQPLEEDSSWMMDGAFEVPSSPPQPAPPLPGSTTNAVAASTGTPVVVDGCRATSFTTWTMLAESDEVVVPVAVEQSQKLLKKVVSGGAWPNNGAGGDAGSTGRTQQEGGIKNHVMSERRRREKLNEMFLALKSLVPSIHKVDKASILSETIVYLKELERRVQELESSGQLISRPSPTETTRLPRRHGNNNVTVRKKVSEGTKRKRSESEAELGGDAEREHGEQQHLALAKDGSSNVTVTVTGKDVLLEVQCRWEELLMTRVFDAIKILHLDVLSVQASAPDGFMGLKIRAQFAGSAVVVPWMISEALLKAIDKR